MKNVKPVTVDEEHRFRDEFPHAVRSGAYGGHSLHLPDLNADKTQPMCPRKTREEWREAEWAAWPVGHEQICKLCAKRARRDHE